MLVLFFIVGTQFWGFEFAHRVKDTFSLQVEPLQGILSSAGTVPFAHLGELGVVLSHCARAYAGVCLVSGVCRAAVGWTNGLGPLRGMLDIRDILPALQSS